MTARHDQRAGEPGWRRDIAPRITRHDLADVAARNNKPLAARLANACALARIRCEREAAQTPFEDLRRAYVNDANDLGSAATVLGMLA